MNETDIEDSISPYTSPNTISVAMTITHIETVCPSQETTVKEMVSKVL